MENKKTKVIVGLSGGVDSAVALINLINEGYDVEAMFMRNWDSAVNNDVMGNPDLLEDVCPQEKDYQDAVKVAEKLGIKLHRVDFIEEYWNSVFAYFLEEYKKNIISLKLIASSNFKFFAASLICFSKLAINLSFSFFVIFLDCSLTSDLKS